MLPVLYNVQLMNLRHPTLAQLPLLFSFIVFYGYQDLTKLHEVKVLLLIPCGLY